MENNNWYMLLYEAENDNRSIERVSDMKKNPNSFAFDYTLKTLQILDEIKRTLNPEELFLIMTTLEWAETAKGCSNCRRNKLSNINFYKHNIGSADLYKLYDKNYNEAVYYMIRSHGLVGQCIRGEMCFSECSDMRKVQKILGYSLADSQKLFLKLNECILRAISDDLWKSLQPEIEKKIYEVLTNNIKEYSLEERYNKINPLTYGMDSILYSRCEKIFEKSLWYPQVVLSEFTDSEISQLFNEIIENENFQLCTDVSFEYISKKLFYEYNNKKKVNVYIKRIIEYYLKNGSNEHISLIFNLKENTLFVDFELSKSCEKLVDFCVEAEKSSILSYQKAISTIFDLFGFRRDELDRLNNEDSYLNTMNEGNSTKKDIIKYVVGENILDVGSGSGIMLNLLEENYPTIKITGTDISENVIEKLNNKKRNENHNWSVYVHNFVNEATQQKYDTIIFSSILHEIYSYNECDGKKFNIDSVKQALKNAYNSLNPGGRIIIRDGIKTDSNKKVFITCGNDKNKFSDVLNVFMNYINDFKGLVDIDRNSITQTSEYIYGDVNFLREFAYTYTWGAESYPHEVNEQFGYFTLSEFVDFVKQLGAIVIKADEYLEDGYAEHLKNKLKFTDEKGLKFYPDSTCFIVIEKNK